MIDAPPQRWAGNERQGPVFVLEGAKVREMNAFGRGPVLQLLQHALQKCLGPVGRDVEPLGKEGRDRFGVGHGQVVS
ncbi:MAG: hypothetical protein BRD41_05580 [Bacteroidetes bacterium QS_1_63_11]|nr:MAG: hypothetical protein BRD41_05580 [Bacteroidetes bacterium QS_1_63_11]